jgi:hypothetical protein
MFGLDSPMLISLRRSFADSRFVQPGQTDRQQRLLSFAAL